MFRETCSTGDSKSLRARLARTGPQMSQQDNTRKVQTPSSLLLPPRRPASSRATSFSGRDHAACERPVPNVRGPSGRELTRNEDIAATFLDDQRLSPPGNCIQLVLANTPLGYNNILGGGRSHGVALSCPAPHVWHASCSIPPLTEIVQHLRLLGLPCLQICLCLDHRELHSYCSVLIQRTSNILSSFASLFS